MTDGYAGQTAGIVLTYGQMEPVMSEATFVAFVPNCVRDQLRDVLRTGDTGALRWSEKKLRGGSEFYFCGPPGLARRTHEYVVQWALRRN